MYCNNGSSSRSQQALRGVKIKVKVLSTNIHEHRPGANIADCFGRRKEGIRRHDYLIPGLYICRLQCYFQCRRPGPNRDYIFRADEPGEFFFEPLYPLTPNKMTRL